MCGMLMESAAAAAGATAHARTEIGIENRSRVLTKLTDKVLYGTVVLAYQPH